MFLINILLIDDHALFSQSLQIALSDCREIETIKSLQDISQLNHYIETRKPDIILMDINLKNIFNEDGLELTRQILHNYPDEKVVILSGYDLPIYRSEAKKIGAKGFINKNIVPEKLVSLLTEIISGALIFEKGAAPIETLTDSEKQVLLLLANGFKRKEIAGMLYISERTLSNHLQHIFEKLHVGSAVEAVTKGIQMGYLPPIC